MVTNQKPTGRASSMPAGLLIGAAGSLIITLIAAFILAKLLDAETLPWENVGYGVMILLLLSSMVGALLAYGKIKRQRMMVCMLSGVIYFGILMSITALFFGGQYDSVGVTALLILGGCGSVGLLGMREKRAGKRKKITQHHR